MLNQKHTTPARTERVPARMWTGGRSGGYALPLTAFTLVPLQLLTTMPTRTAQQQNLTHTLKTLDNEKTNN